MIFPPHILLKPTGIYKVQTEDYWLTEEKEDPFAKDGRQRVILVRRYFPEGYDFENAAEYKPVVVASHGTFGTIRNNISLYNELASKGYEVLAVCHAGQASKMIYQDGSTSGPDKSFIKEVNNLDSQGKMNEAYEIYQKWMQLRIDDLNCVMDDYFQKRNGNCRFIAFGHALGGAASYGIARQREDVVACISLEAPCLCDIKGIENGNYIFDQRDYDIPVLSVYTDSSWSHLKEWKQYANNVRFLESSKPNYRSIHYSGAKNMSLSDLSIHSPLLCATLSGFFTVPARVQLKKINDDCVQFLEDNGL